MSCEIKTDARHELVINPFIIESGLFGPIRVHLPVLTEWRAPNTFVASDTTGTTGPLLKCINTKCDSVVRFIRITELGDSPAYDNQNRLLERNFYSAVPTDDIITTDERIRLIRI